jgi:hypothetical protein
MCNVESRGPANSVSGTLENCSCDWFVVGYVGHVYEVDDLIKIPFLVNQSHMCGWPWEMLVSGS